MAIGIKDYEAVIALSEERHFGRAARRLGVTQPALTSRLYRIEGDLGAQLFERGRDGVTETAEGTALSEYARRVLDAHEEAQRRVQDARFGFGMTLRVGATHLAIHDAVVPSLRAFRSAYPEARIRLTEGATFDLERALEHGSLDIAFLHPPLHAPDLTQHVLTRTKVVLVDCAGDWVPGDPIVRYPRHEAPVMMGDLDRELQKQEGPKPDSTAEASTAIMALALSAAGYGGAFVTETMPDFGFDVAKPANTSPLFDLETAVAFRRQDRRPVIRAFLECVPGYDLAT